MGGERDVKQHATGDRVTSVTQCLIRAPRFAEAPTLQLNEHASTSGLLMLGTSFGGVFRENRPALHERAPVNGGVGPGLILGTSFPRRVPAREPNFDDRRDLGTRSAFELDAPCVIGNERTARELVAAPVFRKLVGWCDRM
jgi:hypothetical protein